MKISKSYFLVVPCKTLKSAVKPIQQEVRRALQTGVSSSQMRNISFLKSKNLHVSLSKISKYQPRVSGKPKLMEKISTQAKKHLSSPFDLEREEHVNQGRLRVLGDYIVWGFPKEESSPLRDYQSTLSRDLKKSGVKLDDSFSSYYPHISIAHIKDRSLIPQIEKILKRQDVTATVQAKGLWQLADGKVRQVALFGPKKTVSWDVRKASK